MDADSAIKGFFGYKNGYIRISDPTTSVSITSDTFRILGALPFVLTSPRGGETYLITDTVNILYCQNQDLTANITVCAKTTDKVDWAQDIGATALISKTLPIRNLSTKFVPNDLANDPEKSVYFNFTSPLQILLADYGENGKRISSGTITIQ